MYNKVLAFAAFCNPAKLLMHYFFCVRGSSLYVGSNWPGKVRIFYDEGIMLFRITNISFILSIFVGCENNKECVILWVSESYCWFVLLLFFVISLLHFNLFMSWWSRVVGCGGGAFSFSDLLIFKSLIFVDEWTYMDIEWYEDFLVLYCVDLLSHSEGQVLYTADL